MAFYSESQIDFCRALGAIGLHRAGLLGPVYPVLVKV